MDESSSRRLCSSALRHQLTGTQLKPPERGGRTVAPAYRVADAMMYEIISHLVQYGHGEDFSQQSPRTTR